MLTHVEDFSLGGTDSFIDRVMNGIQKVLTVSKVERDSFCFTGIDVSSKKDSIEISMEAYSKSIVTIENIRENVKKSERLTKVELKLFRKYVGKNTQTTFFSPLRLRAAQHSNSLTAEKF